jgi:methionine-rich copper-binding protein CopC
LAAFAGAVTVFVALLSGTALAHPRLTSSDPAAGSTVPSPPSQVHTEYSEAIVAGSYMEVTDPCGRSVNSGSTQVGTTSMDQAISAEATGTYTVYWLANGADGHPVEGDFTFSSSGGSPCPGEEPEEEEDPGTGGGAPGAGGGSNRNASSSGGSGGSDEGFASGTSAGSGDGHGGGHKNHRGGSHGNGRGDGGEGAKGGGEDQGGATGPLAGARSDVPDAPSAIEGIPMDGLVITLVVAALIGAAAGKIYVSLSGDES